MVLHLLRFGSRVAQQESAADSSTGHRRIPIVALPLLAATATLAITLCHLSLPLVSSLALAVAAFAQIGRF